MFCAVKECIHNFDEKTYWKSVLEDQEEDGRIFLWVFMNT